MNLRRFSQTLLQRSIKVYSWQQCINTISRYPCQPGKFSDFIHLFISAEDYKYAMMYCFSFHFSEFKWYWASFLTGYSGFFMNCLLVFLDHVFIGFIYVFLIDPYKLFTCSGYQILKWGLLAVVCCLILLMVSCRSKVLNFNILICFNISLYDL